MSERGDVWGEVITVENPREGVIDDGLVAFEERVELAERHWPRGRLEDFEQIDRRGRKWRDTATTTTYRRIGGCGPLMSPTLEDVDVWFIADGKLVLLIRDDRPEVTTVLHGEVVERVLDVQYAPRMVE